MAVVRQRMRRRETALALLNTFKNIDTNEKIMHASGGAERRDSALHGAYRKSLS
jgi:hypothetical protein